MTKESEEFKKFDNTMHKLIRVSHEEIKAKLDAERDKRRKDKQLPLVTK